jgi:hypothetical protein
LRRQAFQLINKAIVLVAAIKNQCLIYTLSQE